MDSRPIDLIIMTGMSGAGKTVAVQSLEDLGYYCVDNLPPVLIPKFLELIVQSTGNMSKVALVLDLRGREFFDAVYDSLDELKRKDYFHAHIVFLDANNQSLVSRYKETRRRHPLAQEGLPLEGIEQERKMLEGLKERAHVIVDTSLLKPAELREAITKSLSGSDGRKLTINIMSFGFKYGIPIDADLVFDVRFLANPHYIEELQPKTGLQPDVADYVIERDETQAFISHLSNLLHFLLPLYHREGKSQVVVAIGCTGGKHRSVALGEYYRDRLGEMFSTYVTHRDIEKDRKNNLNT